MGVEVTKVAVVVGRGVTRDMGMEAAITSSKRNTTNLDIMNTPHHKSAVQ